MGVPCGLPPATELPAKPRPEVGGCTRVPGGPWLLPLLLQGGASEGPACLRFCLTARLLVHPPLPPFSPPLPPSPPPPRPRSARSEHGLRLPLELFRTRATGWGVRCAVDIPAGAVVCSYEGEVITSTEAVRGGGGGCGWVEEVDWAAPLADTHDDPGPI